MLRDVALVQPAMRVVRILADVELPASRLVTCRGDGILAHQRQESVDLFWIDLEINNNDIHRILPCQAAPVIGSMTAAVHSPSLMIL